MKKIFYIAMLAGLLFGCGVKKNTVNQEQAQTERAVVVDSVSTPSDSLPEFLREFANDSTIHINWVDGVPFIIDDSVPMLLPPIDKNPEGYVSNRNFTRCFPKIDYKLNVDLPSELTLIDSILWLNKCANDIYQFLQVESQNVQRGHMFGIWFCLCKLSQNVEIIVIDVSQVPYWSCICKATACEQNIRYCFDTDGNLLGQFFLKTPYYRKGAKRYSHQARYIKNGTLIHFCSSKISKMLGMRINNFDDECCIHEE